MAVEGLPQHTQPHQASRHHDCPSNQWLRSSTWWWGWMQVGPDAGRTTKMVGLACEGCLYVLLTCMGIAFCVLISSCAAARAAAGGRLRRWSHCCLHTHTAHMGGALVAKQLSHLFSADDQHKGLAAAVQLTLEEQLPPPPGGGGSAADWATRSVSWACACTPGLFTSFSSCC
jgi:hypothetical protein